MVQLGNLTSKRDNVYFTVLITCCYVLSGFLRSLWEHFLFELVLNLIIGSKVLQPVVVQCFSFQQSIESSMDGLQRIDNRLSGRSQQFAEY